MEEYMAPLKRNPESVKLAEQIMEVYKPTSIADMHNALKDLFAPAIESMLKGELKNHLGYNANDQAEKSTANRRNGYGRKTLKSSAGTIPIQVPRDRDATFEPKLVEKRQSNIAEIEDKIIAMYARGMSQRDISKTIEEIYGFPMSHEMISNITDCVLEELTKWQQRPLQKCYAFLFVDCMYTTVRAENYEAKEYAVYTILGYDIHGKKEVLGLWLNETESKHKWMQIFDEIRARGVEDVFFISMDGVSGLEQGAKAVFGQQVVVQRCIVHLIRNSLKYIPTKEYKNFTQELKKLYAAPSIEACKANYEAFEEKWSEYPGAVKVWINNREHIERLYDYGHSVRKLMYTTNAIESINSSFRKVIKKGAFPSEKSLLKILYLRIKELKTKWTTTQPNWSMVINQLLINDKFSERVEKYLI